MLRLALAAVVALGLGCGAASEGQPAEPAGSPQAMVFVQLLTLDNTRLTETARLLANTGDDAAKRAGGRALVELVRTVVSDGWRQSQRGVVVRVYAGSSSEAGRGELATPHAVERWLDAWQRRTLVRIYDAMGELDSEPVLVHCRAVTADLALSLAHRQLASAVLAKHKGAVSRPGESWSMPGTSGAGAGTGAPGTGPVATAPEPPRVTGGQIQNASQVVDALRPYFATCYQQALQQYGRFGAWVILHAQVVADGRVAAVSPGGEESAPPPMVACLRSVLFQARFAPPAGGGAVVSVPLSFTVR